MAVAKALVKTVERIVSVRNPIPSLVMGAMFWLAGMDQRGGYQGTWRHVMRLISVIAPLSALAVWFLYY